MQLARIGARIREYGCPRCADRGVILLYECANEGLGHSSTIPLLGKRSVKRELFCRRALRVRTTRSRAISGEAGPTMGQATGRSGPATKQAGNAYQPGRTTASPNLAATTQREFRLELRSHRCVACWDTVSHMQIPRARHRNPTNPVQCENPPVSRGVLLVGVSGFEPPAPASRRRCSTRLSYTPAGRPAI